MIGTVRVAPDSTENDAEILPPYEGDKPRYADQMAACDAIDAERRAEQIRKSSKYPWDPEEYQHHIRMTQLKNAERELYQNVPGEPKPQRTDPLARQYVIASRVNAIARERFAAICAKIASECTDVDTLRDADLDQLGLSPVDVKALLHLEAARARAKTAGK